MKKLALFLSVLIAMNFAACKPREERPADSERERAPLTEEAMKRITINIGTEPETLDPSLARGIPEAKVLDGTMETLVTLDADGNAVPGAAERWEHNEDYTEWTFYLRPEAKWHDGEPVTSHDFLFALERILTPSTQGPYAQIVYEYLEDGEEFYDGGGLDAGMELNSVETVDDRTLKLKLANPTTFFLTVVSHGSWMPLNEQFVKQAGRDFATGPEHFLGNGPFELVDYQPRNRIVLKKSDRYWDRENIFWEEVVLRMIDNEGTELAAFVSGELDVTESIALPEVPRWKSRPEFTTFPYLGTYYIGFQTQRDPFDDVRVRRAFSMVIDRELIVSRVTRRNEPPGTGIIPVGLQSVEGGDLRKKIGPLINPSVTPEIVEEARQLLADAGYPNGEGFPAISYMYNTADEHKIIGEQLQAMWKAHLGVDVRLENVEWGVKLKRSEEGDYHVARQGWIGDYYDPMTFLDIFTSGNPHNDPNLENERYDELIYAAKSETDPLKREEMLMEAEKILVEEEVAVGPIYFYTEPFLMKTDIEGLERNALGDLLYMRARRVRD